MGDYLPTYGIGATADSAKDFVKGIIAIYRKFLSPLKIKPRI